MKLYSEYPYASISMSKDAEYRAVVESILKTNTVKSILESGTFNGLGSTSMLSDIIVENNIKLNFFYTLEVEEAIYHEAVNNLKKYPFVKPIFGMSLTKDACIKFIETDEAINHHEKYPNIFIDSIINPKEFYTKEIEGNLTMNIARKKSLKEKVIAFLKGEKSFLQDGLRKIVPSIKNDNPIVLLDSAGGIGLLEFNTLCELMGDKSYYLILDDVHHLKHFRSLEHVRNNQSFNIMDENLEQGWVVAKHL